MPLSISIHDFPRGKPVEWERLEFQAGHPQPRRYRNLMSGTAIRAALALKDKTHVRHNYLDPAMRDGSIDYTLPEHPNSRLQQYRLTDKGRALLAALQVNQP